MDIKDFKIFSNIPLIKTERLTLRKITKKDLEDVYRYASDEEVSKFLLWSPHKSREQTKLYLKNITAAYNRGEYFDWGIEYEGHIIGTVGFTTLDAINNKGEIGYVLSSEFWGKGIACEAAQAIIKFGFDVLMLERLEARFMIENKSSRRVLEKLGLKEEGVIRHGVFAKGKYRDICLYSILSGE